MLLKKQAADSYLQTFYNFIGGNKNRGLFVCLKEKYEKEKH